MSDHLQFVNGGWFVAGKPVKRAVIDNATSGNNTLVAAVTGKKIAVHALLIVATDAVTIRLESGAGGTALTGQMTHAAASGEVLPWSLVPWVETAAGALLNLELSGAVSADGVLLYTEV